MKKNIQIHSCLLKLSHKQEIDRRTDRQTDRWTAAITISPTLSRGDKKDALDSQPQVLKFTNCLPMVGGSLRVLLLRPPLTLVAMI